jgi:hypothetical protein
VSSITADLLTVSGDQPHSYLCPRCEKRFSIDNIGTLVQAECKLCYTEKQVKDLYTSAHIPIICEDCVALVKSGGNKISELFGSLGGSSGFKYVRLDKALFSQIKY